MSLQLSNPEWTREAVVAQFSDEGPHAELYKALRAWNDRDFFLNAGYSRSGQRHWGPKAPVRLVDRLARRLRKLSNGEPELLDLGCGRGGPAFRLHDRWGMNVTGIDLSEINVEAARLRVRAREIHEGLTFARGNAETLGFAGESFTFAWSIESAGFMESKRRFLGEVYRVLRPGGALAMAAVLLNEEVATGSREDLDRYAAFLLAWDFPHLATVQNYRDLLKDVGFEVRRVEIATQRVLEPHRKRLERLMKYWRRKTLYRLSKHYVRRKTGADLDPIREQLAATYEALAAGVLDYGLFWAVKPADSKK